MGALKDFKGFCEKYPVFSIFIATLVRDFVTCQVLDKVKVQLIWVFFGGIIVLLVSDDRDVQPAYIE